MIFLAISLQEWIKDREWQDCSVNSGKPARVECSIPPKDSPFRTIQAKKAFEAYRQKLDRQCKEHACQRLDCGIGSKSGSDTSNGCFRPPFSHALTQEELLRTIWKTTPYPQTLESIRHTVLTEVSPIRGFGGWHTKVSEQQEDAVREKLNACIEQQKCGPRIIGWKNDYCVKTKCAKENENFFAHFSGILNEYGLNFWALFQQKKIPEICPKSVCVISDQQIEDAVHALRKK